MTQATSTGKGPTPFDLVGSPAPGFNRGVSTAPTTYALAPALRVRLLGTGLLTSGLLVAGGALLVVVGMPVSVLSGLVVLALVLVVVVALLLGVRRWVLRLDEHGYRVRVLRAGEARSARWSDVLDLQTAEITGGRGVLLRLRDGRTTSLPVDAIEGDPEALVEEITTRLDRGHGYRRLR